MLIFFLRRFAFRRRFTLMRLRHFLPPATLMPPLRDAAYFALPFSDDAEFSMLDFVQRFSACCRRCVYARLFYMPILLRYFKSAPVIAAAATRHASAFARFHAFRAMPLIMPQLP